MAGKNISVDGCFKDAENSGILDLCGRNLKEWPNVSEDCELIDVIECDISKNRFLELPPVICEFVMLEKLNCHHNNIRSIPDASHLTSLTWLNLSRNQLSSLPEHICLLPLKVLIASSNRLSCLPEEISMLKQIQYMDLSCNELVSLPESIGELSTLKELNIRRNMLEKFPDEMCKLNLVKLDFSCNQITVIPPTFRFLSMLTDLILDNNPLQCPPAQLCTRGRGHIFKYLARMQEKSKEPTKLSLSQLSSNSILTEANLLPSKHGEEKERKKSPNELKDRDTNKMSLPRGSLLDAEYQRTRHIVTDDQNLDHFAYDEFLDGDNTGITNTNQKPVDDDANLREASRKLQARREQQKENVRQKNVEGSRNTTGDRSLDRRKQGSGKSKPKTVKIIGKDNKPSVVKKVEVTDNMKEDLKKSLDYERRKLIKERGVDHNNADSEETEEDGVTPFPGIHKRHKHATPASAFSSSIPNFTVRRMYENTKEEFEKVEMLREAIENRLKVRLPDDISACLADGTVLCHFLNYLQKGTVAQIFVPTPNMPKLTMNKCVKNVDHFLTGCLKLGVERDKLCNPSDIVQEKNPGNVWVTVDALLRVTHRK